MSTLAPAPTAAPVVSSPSAYYVCDCCGAASFTHGFAQDMGLTLTPDSVPHDVYCPGRVFPGKHVSLAGGEAR